MNYLERYNQIAQDPAASFWLKAAIATLARRDPLDAGNDATILVELCNLRIEEVLAEAQ